MVYRPFGQLHIPCTFPGGGAVPGTRAVARGKNLSMLSVCPSRSSQLSVFLSRYQHGGGLPIGRVAGSYFTLLELTVFM
jgi:hypothetical protein